MDDNNIIELYWSREEAAISETKNKYGSRLMGLAMNITTICEDAEECVSDTYQAAWTTIPPKRPDYLFAYLARITRHSCFNLLDYNSAKKRKSIIVSLTAELENCIEVPENEERWIDSREIAKAVSAFLRVLPEEQRAVFMRRYWYADSIADLAGEFNMSKSKIKSMLFRIRNKLRVFLEKEGICV